MKQENFVLFFRFTDVNYSVYERRCLGKLSLGSHTKLYNKLWFTTLACKHSFFKFYLNAVPRENKFIINL